MNYENDYIQVYVKTDLNNNVIDINSSIFLSNTTGWFLIDEGIGDKYAHAQGQYLKKPLINIDGTYNYKYNNGMVVEL